MTEPRPLRHLSLSYNNSDSRASALRLIFTLLPSWETEEGQVEFVRFTDGITNTLLKAVKRRPGWTEVQADSEAVLLRAYGRGTEILIDRERETASHLLLASHRLAPELLARFQNGMIYRFIRGRVCSPADLRTERVWRGVARKLGEWHAVLPIASAVPAAPTAGRRSDDSLSLEPRRPVPTAAEVNAITPGKSTPNIWTVMQKWIFALPETGEKEKKRKAVLQKELESAVGELGNRPGLGEKGLVMGHCDLLSGNVIIIPTDGSMPKDSSAETVSFIDYEYTAPSPAAFDIANHFAEWGGFECDYEALPTSSTRRAFILEYLRSYYSSLPSHMAPKTDMAAEMAAETNRLCGEVDLFRGIPGFYWGIWALIQALISQIDFDYAAYAEVRLSEYWAWRSEHDGTRTRQGKGLCPRERRWAQE